MIQMLNRKKSNARKNMDWLLADYMAHQRRVRRRAIWWRIKYLGYPIAACAIVYLWAMSKVIS